eukprot:c3299_g1_i1.p1 GENE.c3299_g1_i1~~c3299_g1_i1.p1  ORF type:complete len:181 (-),score=31.93 c3299_g1_i1:205-747(-)
MRKLKYHEQKLLKKTDLLQWKNEKHSHEMEVIRRYHIQERDDYVKYNRISGMVTKLTNALKNLDIKDPLRDEISELLLAKLFAMGLITTKKLTECHQLSTSTFCRRRLPVVMVRLKMAETVKMAVTYVEQGHVRVGPEIVTDPAFLVTRSMEDFVTWTDQSKIKTKVLAYNNKLDDFDLL